jgi:anti-sigma factor RsiW
MSQREPGKVSESDLHAYVDGALSVECQNEVEAYLLENPDALKQVRAFSAQRQALRTALRPIALESVPQNLHLAALVRKHQRPANTVWRNAAAIVLAVATGALGGWTVHDSRSDIATAGLSALAREASNSYAVYAEDLKRPVEMAAEQRSELIDWVSLRLRRPIAAPDLSKSGYQFIGGRLVSTDHGPAGLFMYDAASGIRIALLVRPMAIQQDAPMLQINNGKLAGFTWSDHGLGYSVVSKERAELLHPLANEVRRQIIAAL